MAAVTIKNINKYYEAKKAVLSTVSLNVKDGEFLVIVGPSGSGKSTLLRMIAGLEVISEGEILIRDRIINNLPPGERNVSMVFQNYALFPHLSVFDNIAFGLKIRKIPKKEVDQMVHDTAELLRLIPHLHKKPRELSGGQCQRVALGRAIVREPDVFLFDEPLSNLDAKLRSELRTELLLLHRRLKTTMIYVTHDQVEAMTLGDRICVLRDGIVQQFDTPDAVFNNPVNDFVASFFGTPPMNIITGMLVRQQDRFMIKAGSSEMISLGRENKIEFLKRYCDQMISIGFRPRAMVTRKTEMGAIELSGEVEYSELLGEERLIHFSWAGQSVIACLPANSQAAVKSPFICSIAPRQLYFFDKTGNRLSSLK